MIVPKEILIARVAQLMFGCKCKVFNAQIHLDDGSAYLHVV